MNNSVLPISELEENIHNILMENGPTSLKDLSQKLNTIESDIQLVIDVSDRLIHQKNLVSITKQKSTKTKKTTKSIGHVELRGVELHIKKNESIFDIFGSKEITFVDPIDGYPIAVARKGKVSSISTDLLFDKFQEIKDFADLTYEREVEISEKKKNAVHNTIDGIIQSIKRDFSYI